MTETYLNLTDGDLIATFAVVMAFFCVGLPLAWKFTGLFTISEPRRCCCDHCNQTSELWPHGEFVDHAEDFLADAEGEALPRGVA